MVIKAEPKEEDEDDERELPRLFFGTVLLEERKGSTGSRELLP